MVRTEKSGLIIALDFGTSNLKGAVYDLNGKELAYKAIEYDLYTPANSIVENNVTLYWDNIITILKDLSKKLGKRSKEVLAIGTSSQGETIVPIDKNGNPLRNAIVWIDTRTTAETVEIAQNFDSKKMYRMTGYPEVDTSWPATRILWIKKNEPIIFKDTYKFLLLEDYIVYKLTGMFVGEASVYSSSYYYDIVKNKYIDSMLDFLNIGIGKLPEILNPGSIVGGITQEVAEITGFNKGTKVVIGAMDQICGAVGAGNINSGAATETTGSCFAMIITTGDPIFNDQQKIPCCPHAVPGLYALMPYSPTGGMVLKWFKDRFCNEELRTAEKEGINIFKLMDDLASEIPAGSEGLLMLPFISGALFPEYNPDARGVYFNFGINHQKAHFIRAILESIGYLMRNYIESANSLDIRIEKVISIGGGATSKLWGQIKSDICGLQVVIPEYTEMALLGSAVLTATAIGLFKNISDANKNLMKIRDVFLPDDSKKTVYDKNFDKYKKLYKNLKDLF
jgi:sugar (pentulose or hexulose) kinase